MSCSSDDQSDKECPLCMEPLEIDDVNFYPCKCEYQICRFCWHRLRTDENGLCPACRQPYPEDPVNFKPLSTADLQKIKSEKKMKQQAERQRISESRKHLATYRVLQKNLVYVVGLSLRVADAEVLKRHEYFGKFGKICKVAVGSTTAGGMGKEASSHTAYVTYSKVDEALRAIQGVQNALLDGRMVKASLGTTKYCSSFLRSQQCYKPECMYLHDAADTDISFTKEDMHAGKHAEYERKLMENILRPVAVAAESLPTRDPTCNAAHKEWEDSASAVVSNGRRRDIKEEKTSTSNPNGRKELEGEMRRGKAVTSAMQVQVSSHILSSLLSDSPPDDWQTRDDAPCSTEVQPISSPSPPPGWQNLSAAPPSPPPGWQNVPAAPPSPPPGWQNLSAAPPSSPPGWQNLSAAPPSPPPGWQNLSAAPPSPPPGWQTLAACAPSPPPQWQTLLGLAPPIRTSLTPSNGFCSDDDLGFDPYAESSRELAALVEEEKRRERMPSILPQLFGLPPHLQLQSGYSLSHLPPHLCSEWSASSRPLHYEETLSRPLHPPPLPVQRLTPYDLLHPMSDKPHSLYDMSSVLTPPPPGLAPPPPPGLAPLPRSAPSHSSTASASNTRLTMSEWQEGLKALLPNVNVRFAENLDLAGKDDSSPSHMHSLHHPLTTTHHPLHHEPYYR